MSYQIHITNLAFKGSLSISTNTGEILLENVTAQLIDIRANLGKTNCYGIDTYHDTSICCGTGGGAQHYRLQYESVYVDQRIAEAKEVHADVIVVFCPTCGMQLLDNPYGIKVKHILQIVFGIENELEDSLYKKQHLFDGVDGKRRQKNLKESPIINSVKSI